MSNGLDILRGRFFALLRFFLRLPAAGDRMREESFLERSFLGLGGRMRFIGDDVRFDVVSFGLVSRLREGEDFLNPRREMAVCGDLGERPPIVRRGFLRFGERLRALAEGEVRREVEGVVRGLVVGEALRFGLEGGGVARRLGVVRAEVREVELEGEALRFNGEDLRGVAFVGVRAPWRGDDRRVGL